MSAADIAKALGGRRQGSQWKCCCPAHEDIEPSLSVCESRGKLLLHCFAGCSFASILAALRSRGLIDERSPQRYEPNPELEKQRRKQQAAEREWRIVRAREVWRSSRPAEGTPVEVYLRCRGYNGQLPPTLRSATLMHSDTGLMMPCMVAAVAVWPSREVVAVHRTFLTADGTRKAGVTSNKKMLGPVAAGAVRLAPAGQELAVSEGVETGLSVLQHTALPTWAALSAGGIEALILPSLPLAETVYVAADNDPRGLAAANSAAFRWLDEGRHVKIVPPSTPGADWNDEVRNAA